MSDNFWTEERTAELQRLRDEEVSCGNIGKLLGCSKGAVAGKLHRMQLPPPPPPPPHPLLAVGPNDCRWPIGDPGHPDFRFCTAPVIIGRPYCPDHEARAYTTLRPR